MGRTQLASEQFDGRSLLDRAISAVQAVCPRVLVISPDAAASTMPPQLEWLTPSSDADFHDAVASYDRVLIHDLACPTTPASFLREIASADGQAVAAVSQLTDTVKVMDAGRVAQTIERDRVVVVASPVVADRDVITQVPRVLDALRDLAVLVELLRAITAVALRPAPAEGRRVSDPDDLRVAALRRLA
ncbi:MAG TPA: 2-C-methyl-D-erythritol 4-phosphate cytidylyltransferase [Nocardioidaceae bacterium]|nr:2-C-methyl-D-erythritol 4-phosphate cytidylyltransferase [Nocardioidaceae bacterium]